MIGYSWPRSRYMAACVPAMFVRSVLATPVTVRPSSAAFWRSTWTASSGRPSSWPMRTSAMPGVSSIRVFAASLRFRESVRSWPRISSDRRLSPPPSMRLSWKLPPEARAEIRTPAWPDSSRRSAWAISSLERVRSVLGTRVTVSWPR